MYSVNLRGDCEICLICSTGAWGFYVVHVLGLCAYCARSLYLLDASVPFMSYGKLCMRVARVNCST